MKGVGGGKHRETRVRGRGDGDQPILKRRVWGQGAGNGLRTLCLPHSPNSHAAEEQDRRPSVPFGTMAH